MFIAQWQSVNVNERPNTTPQVHRHVVAEWKVVHVHTQSLNLSHLITLTLYFNLSLKHEF